MRLQFRIKLLMITEQRMKSFIFNIFHFDGTVNIKLMQPEAEVNVVKSFLPSSYHR